MISKQTIKVGYRLSDLLTYSLQLKECEVKREGGHQRTHCKGKHVYRRMVHSNQGQSLVLVRVVTRDNIAVL